jgi:hypothetical protein
MSQKKLWIAIAVLQVPLSHVGGQTCPLNDSSLTIVDATQNNRDTSNFNIKFDGCDHAFGPSGWNGVVTYGPCPSTSSAATTFSRNHPAAGWTLRNASFTPAPTQVLAAVVQDSSNHNPILSFLLSGGGATILAALISGLFGTFITYFLQKRRFERERDQTVAAENRAKHSEELDKQREFFRSAYQLVGRCIAAGQDLIAIATPEFESKTPGPRQAQAKEELRVAFDATEKFWKAERYSTSLLITLDHPDQDQIQKIWSEIDAAIASYFDVCKKIYNEYRVSRTLVTSQQKAAVKNDYENRIEVAMNNLKVEIEAARQSSDSGCPVA